MVKMRYEILEQDTAKASGLTAAIERIDLPRKGILTELTIQVRSLGAFSDDLVTPMWVILQKVEVLVKGAQVIKSFTGNIMRALEWYNHGPFGMSCDYWGEDNNQARYRSFTIYFNRFHGDTAYGLDLAAYENPQLVLDWDTTIASSDGLTYDVHGTPTFTYSVIAKIYDGSPAGFQGKYVKTSIIDQWTTAASDNHQTEIPLGFPLRGLIYRGAYVGINNEYTLEKIKLDFDNGAWVPIEMNYAQFWNVFKSWFPEPVHVGMTIRTDDTPDFDPQVYKVVSFSNAPAGANQIIASLTTSRRPFGAIMALTASATASTTAATMWFNVFGWGPMQCLYIPMSQLMDGAVETIATSGFGRIVLTCTSGASSGTSGYQYIVAEYDIPNGQ